MFQANSPVDPTDKNKTTPLHLTARYGHDKTTSLLIEHGASLTQVMKILLFVHKSLQNKYMGR